MSENRLCGADFMRAAACLTVLFHHLAQRMSWNAHLGPVEWFRVFTQIGTYGVAMFFVLSGFLLSRPFWQALDAGAPLPSIRTYATRRAARILPGFWLALAVSFVFSVAVFGAKLDVWLLIRLAAGFLGVSDWHWLTLFPVEVNGPLWSIGFEITSYVLLPFGLFALFALRPWTGTGWQSRIAWIGVIAPAVFAHWTFTRYVKVDTLLRGWDYGLQGGAKFWMPRYNPLGFFAMFAIGALAGGVQVRLAKYRNLSFDALVLASLGLTVWCFAQQMRQPNPDGFGWLGIPYGFPWFVLAIGMVLAVTPSSVWIGRALDNPVSRYIARISFGIYVWHYLVLELVRLYVSPDIDHGRMVDPVKFVLISALITALTFIIGALSFRYIENPIIRWARGREAKTPENATLSPAAG